MSRFLIVCTVLALVGFPLIGNGASDPAPSQPGPINLRLATPSPPFPLVGTGNLVVFQVNESRQGHGDLNGDGDTGDDVLHLFDAATGTITNLGLASPGQNVAADGNLVAFTVSESEQGNADLNGDGDTNDDVLHLLDVPTGKITNLGLAVVGPPAVHGHRVVFAVSESGQSGKDLNGDGDAADPVVHVYDASTGTLTNLGLASTGKLLASQNLISFTVNEASQGHTDLNGDGDATDYVLHVYDPTTDSTINLGLALWNGLTFASDGNLVTFVVSESQQGGTDLNGDGDIGDEVVHVFNAATMTTTNLGVAQAEQISGAPGRPSVSGNLVVFPISESAQGKTDLNGDGDTSDSVLHVYDVATGTLTNLRLALFPGPPAVSVDGKLVAFSVYESAQAHTDLNGDGDAFDMVEHVYDAATGTVTNLKLASLGLPVVSGNLVAFSVSEFLQGFTDLNGNGSPFDSVVHVFDARTGTTRNLRLASTDAFSPSTLTLNGKLLAFPVPEFLQGNLDLNGDGDAFDFVLHALFVSSSAS